MDSTPAEKQALIEMEFDKEMAEFKTQEPDHELLQIQRRKSMPKVVIEEFVHDESQNEVEDVDKLGTPHKVMTHHEIDDVSNFRKVSLKLIFALLVLKIE